MYEYEEVMSRYRKKLFLDTPLKSGEGNTYPDLLEKQDAITRDEQVIK
jgi:hypothetical protein